jgi:hypothetical protein
MHALAIEEHDASMLRARVRVQVDGVAIASEENAILVVDGDSDAAHVRLGLLGLHISVDEVGIDHDVLVREKVECVVGKTHEVELLLVPADEVRVTCRRKEVTGGM